MPINKETILSVYDDKLTLVKWLKKVEDALENDALQSVSFVQGENQIALKFTFESSEITTDFVSNFSIEDLHAVSVTTETLNADNIAVDGDINCNGSINASDEVKSDDITARNTLSSMERLIDANGNFRFVEGNITTFQIPGITFTYGKWSLSGTHLMILLTGTAVASTELQSAVIWGELNVPQFILNKMPLIVDGSVAIGGGIFYGTTQYQSQALLFSLDKITISGGQQRLRILKRSPQTVTYNGVFKLQFDFLIDAN